MRPNLENEIMEEQLYLVVASGEKYDSKIAERDQFVNVIAGLLYSDPMDMPPEDRDAWWRDINDPDSWASDDDLGPVEFARGIGEIDQLRIFKIVNMEIIR